MALFVGLTYFTADYFVGVFLTYGLMMGIGIGIAYSCPMVIAHRWFPENKGFASGILMAGYGLGSSVFNIFQSSYINPDNLLPDYAPYPSHPHERFFDDSDLLNRVPVFYTRLGFVYFLVQWIGAWCFVEFPPARHLFSHPNPSSLESNTTSNAKPKSVWWCLDYPHFWLLWFIMFLISLAVGFSTSYWKVLGAALVGANDWDLAKVGAALCVANAGGRLFWGYIADKLKSSKHALMGVTVFAVLFLSTLSFVASMKSTFMFGFWMFGVFFSIGGSYALFPGICTEAFGTSHFASIYGYLFSSQACSVLLGAWIHSWMMPLLGLALMPTIMAGACAICVILLLNYPDKPAVIPTILISNEIAQEVQNGGEGDEEELSGLVSNNPKSFLEV